MDSTLDGQIHAVFKPFDNLIKPLLELIDSGFKPRDRVVKIGFGRQITNASCPAASAPVISGIMPEARSKGWTASRAAQPDERSADSRSGASWSGVAGL